MQAVALILSSILALSQAAETRSVLGTPVTVNFREDQCFFLIGDAWSRDAIYVEQALVRSPDKGHRIDVLWADEDDRQCVAPALSAIDRAGFKNVVVRMGSPDEYPDPLRATAP